MRAAGRQFRPTKDKNPIRGPSAVGAAGVGAGSRAKVPQAGGRELTLCSCKPIHPLQGLQTMKARCWTNTQLQSRLAWRFGTSLWTDSLPENFLTGWCVAPFG